MEFTHRENQIALYSDSSELLAEITFPYIDSETVNIDHTFVDVSLRGQGIAGKLMVELVRELESRKLKAVPTCSYAVEWFSRHQEYSGLLK
ncbi:MAG TPA: N-acetyltransferase [Candidatus Mediterraneibacter pullistercoris]|nr:N-acetyltransferase [Candidatus Mediterraneibacter pullistercoris]